jgi:hypothetical protein
MRISDRRGAIKNPSSRRPPAPKSLTIRVLAPGLAAGALCFATSDGALAQAITIEGTTDPSIAQTWDRSMAPPGSVGCGPPCTVGYAAYTITPSPGVTVMTIDMVGTDDAPPATTGPNPPDPSTATDPFLLLYNTSFDR